MKATNGITAVLMLLSMTCYAGCSSLYGEYASRISKERIMNSKNYNGKKFVNTIPVRISKKGTVLSTMWKWITGGEERQPPHKLEKFRTDPGQLASPPSSELRVTWINHSTVLIEIDGKRFLTDPIWSKRASPIFFAGPVRFFDPPIRLEELPGLDGVIISHDHYDHLDEATIKKLGKLGVPFYMPLGVGEHLEKWKIPKDQIHEFDWWESIQLDGNHTLIATPACHFSGRNMFKRDTTLWASWVIIGEKHRVYFGGDSGYFPGHREIGEKYGPFDLTILEIGAYHTNWGAIHLGPANAVLAHLDLKGKVLLPVHWGTFTLALHKWEAPVEELLVAAKSRDIALMLPRPGQPVSAPNMSLNSGWWKSRRIAKSIELLELAD